MPQETREYFFDVDRRGTVTRNGVELDDPDFLTVLFRNVTSDPKSRYAAYPFISVCGNEVNFLKPDHSPIVYSSLSGNRLMVTPKLGVDFDPTELTIDNDGILFHRWNKEIHGVISTPIISAIASQIFPWGPYFCYEDTNGRKHPILRQADRARYRILRPRADNTCFGCGQLNTAGLALSFLFDSQNARSLTWLQPPALMTGSLGIMHGGFVSLLLDEAMGKVLSGLGVKGPTAKLDVNFRRPVRMDSEIEVRGQLVRQQGRKYFLEGQFVQSGNVCADGSGLFVQRRSDGAGATDSISVLQSEQESSDQRDISQETTS